MAFGDVGGAVTELVITCQTPATGSVDIAKGDAVKLSGPYTVTNATAAEDVIFGQALASSAENGAAIPVRVRGVCIFEYTGAAPTVDGSQGVLASATAGKVKAPLSGNGIGVNLKVEAATAEVHVLM